MTGRPIFTEAARNSFLHGVGAVVAGAALDHVDRGVRDELQHVAGLQADVLHAQVTRHVIAHLAERLLEVRAQLAGAMQEHQVFERIEDARLHELHVRVLREHERQLLLEHQHAGRDRRDDVVAVVHHLLQVGDVEVLVVRDGLQITQFELGHATALFLRDEADFDAVVLEHLHEVDVEVGLVTVAVAGGEDRHAAGDGRARCSAAAGRRHGCPLRRAPVWARR